MNSQLDLREDELERIKRPGDGEIAKQEAGKRVVKGEEGRVCGQVIENTVSRRSSDVCREFLKFPVLLKHSQ
jgi:hypothetical protein